MHGASAFINPHAYLPVAVASCRRRTVEGVVVSVSVVTWHQDAPWVRLVQGMLVDGDIFQIEAASEFFLAQLITIYAELLELGG